MISVTNKSIKYIEEKSRNIGREIIKLARGKKSFGSFFLPYESKEVMTYLPYFQHAIWGVPMNDNFDTWEYHQFNQLNKVKEYDFAIIFKFKLDKKDDVFIEPAIEYGKNKYFIVIQAKDEDNIGEIRFRFITEFMKDNPYLGEGNLSDNPVKFDD